MLVGVNTLFVYFVPSYHLHAVDNILLARDQCQGSIHVLHCPLYHVLTSCHVISKRESIDSICMDSVDP